MELVNIVAAKRGAVDWDSDLPSSPAEGGAVVSQSKRGHESDQPNLVLSVCTIPQVDRHMSFVRRSKITEPRSLVIGDNTLAFLWILNKLCRVARNSLHYDRPVKRTARRRMIAKAALKAQAQTRSQHIAGVKNSTIADRFCFKGLDQLCRRNKSPRRKMALQTRMLFLVVDSIASMSSAMRTTEKLWD